MKGHRKYYSKSQKRKLDEADSPNICTAYLMVWGMGSPDCAVRVYNALSRAKGVVQVGIVLERGVAAAVYDAGSTTPEEIVKAVAEIDCTGRHKYSAELSMVVSPEEIFA